MRHRLPKLLTHHIRTGPILSSWRDLVDLLFLDLITVIFIYLLLCRAGFTAWDKAILFIFRPIMNRVQQQHHHQQQLRQQPSPLSTTTTETVPKNQTCSRSPGNSILDDGVRDSHVYTTD